MPVFLESVAQHAPAFFVASVAALAARLYVLRIRDVRLTRQQVGTEVLAGVVLGPIGWGLAHGAGFFDWLPYVSASIAGMIGPMPFIRWAHKILGIDPDKAG